MRKRPSSLFIHLTTFYVRQRCGRNHESDRDAVVILSELDVICQFKSNQHRLSQPQRAMSRNGQYASKGVECLPARRSGSGLFIFASLILPKSLLRGKGERERDLPLNKEGERPKGCTTTRPIPNPLTLCHSSASLCYGSTITMKKIFKESFLSLPHLAFRTSAMTRELRTAKWGKGFARNPRIFPGCICVVEDRDLEHEKFLREIARSYGGSSLIW